jgi:hypothetical protein
MEEEDVLNEITELTEKKPCKTCGSGNSDSKKSTYKLVGLGITVLFTSFYGVVKIVQDIIHLFAR